jgi:hypothetical protein
LRRRVIKPTLSDESLIGVAGEYVRLVEEHTEASRPAILTQLLATSGTFLGRTAYYRVEGDQHYTNLDVLVIGATSKARKGPHFRKSRAYFLLFPNRFERQISSLV